MRTDRRDAWNTVIMQLIQAALALLVGLVLIVEAAGGHPRFWSPWSYAGLAVCAVCVLAIVVPTYGMRMPRRSPRPHDDRLAAGTCLLVGESRYSRDRRFRLTVQGDGNLVVCRCSDDQAMSAVGSDGTGQANYLEMQGDHNVVLYTAERIPLASMDDKMRRGGSHLVLCDDGRVVLRTRWGKTIQHDVIAALEKNAQERKRGYAGLPA
jgi:hypothetical protein